MTASDSKPVLEPGVWGTYGRAPEPPITYTFVESGNRTAGAPAAFEYKEGSTTKIMLFSMARGELVGTLHNQGAVMQFATNAGGPLGEWLALPLAHWQLDSVGHVNVGGKEVGVAELGSRYDAEATWVRHSYQEGSETALPVEYSLQLGEAPFPSAIEGADTLMLQDWGVTSPRPMPTLPDWFRSLVGPRGMEEITLTEWNGRDLPPAQSDEAAFRLHQARQTLMGDQDFASAWNHAERRFCEAQLSFFRPVTTWTLGWNWRIGICLSTETVSGTVRWDPILSSYTIVDVVSQVARTIAPPASMPPKAADFGDVTALVLPLLQDGETNYTVRIALSASSTSTLVFEGEPSYRQDAMTYEFLPQAGSGQPNLEIHAGTGVLGAAQWLK